MTEYRNMPYARSWRLLCNVTNCLEMKVEKSKSIPV